VFDQWVEFRRLSLKEGRQSTLPQILRIFKKDLLPTHGRLSIYDINRHDQFDLLSGIEQREALTTAEKCRIWFKQLFR
jgi:integrase